MHLARVVVRFGDADREALNRLRARCFGEARLRPSRAALARLLVGRGLGYREEPRPVREQLPLQALAGERRKSPRPPPREGPSLRARIVAEMTASPGEVFTPARLSPLVGATSKDSVRNTLLVLHAKGRVMKVGPG